MYDLQLIESRIMAIAEEMGLSKNKLLTNAQLGRAFFDNMKQGKIPSIERMHILADYMDVSLDYLTGRTTNPEINKTPVIKQEFSNIIKIPLTPSKASAGTGAVLSDDYSEEIEVDISVYPKADFAVQIAGDSMQPKFIDGDIVLVHKQPALLNNQIGIFMLNGEGYIKKYTVNADGSSVTLVSLNPKYPDIIVSPDDDFRISGRVLYTL